MIFNGFLGGALFKEKFLNFKFEILGGHYFEEYDNYYIYLIFKPLDPFERRLKII